MSADALPMYDLSASYLLIAIAIVLCHAFVLFLAWSTLRRVRHDLTCVHDFVHWYGELIDEQHPLHLAHPRTRSPFHASEASTDVRAWDEGVA
jgi:hypothetical protein